jgi:hypothetical protein
MILRQIVDVANDLKRLQARASTRAEAYSAAFKRTDDVIRLVRASLITAMCPRSALQNGSGTPKALSAPRR